ncbi:hypothetical protein PILCRDRAFT_71546 [Piloderma croceum F 1598]|uniref:tRNA (cytosine(38)-C(5))-methyltransferase n=1 Tax=Piloderma croceum (strain F 1598) TaxID=765440 RepID=A0A0C3FRF2_PILCF|nr:hypothetical protein PILCRDRAFT_71546 [Piloderma croceum F 1598]
MNFNEPREIRAVEFYSGIGGLHLALKRSLVPGTVVRAFDWDQAARQVYAANYGPKIAQKADILTLNVGDLAPLLADLWLLSPSCQPYTVINPLAKGSADPRAKSFLHLIQNVLPELVAVKQNPRYLLVENVGGFENSHTRQILLSTLKSLGYTTIELLLTPLQFRIPNSRLRYYLLAKAKPLSFSCSQCSDVNSVDELSRYLDAEVSAVNSHLHAVPDRVLRKWGRLFDIVLPSSRRSCCFTRGYTQLVERAGSILQMNQALDVRLYAERILDHLQLRYFSPSELLRLFYFDASSEDSHISCLQQPFLWPGDISTKTKYRLIGNSVNVKVVTALIDFLFEEASSA